MRIFKNKWFERWARKEGVADESLLNAAAEIITGKVEADLGGSLFKKRLPLKGMGIALLLATKSQTRRELFFCTPLPRTYEPIVQQKKKPL